MSKKFLYKFISKDDLDLISAKIREIEKITSGELVITIKEKRTWLEKNKSVRALAEKEFVKSGIAKTIGSTGILLFILFNAKEFCILADKSINAKVSQSVWDEIANNISLQFKSNNFCKGIINAIDEAGNVLAAHFPIQPGDINELSNDVRIK